MSFIQDIEAAVKTKLDAMTHFNGAYTYEPDKPTSGQYPFATIIYRGSEAVFGDTIRNLRRYTFAIRVYQERTSGGFGNEKAERVLREICDEVIDAFDADTTLGGVVKFIRPIRCDTTYEDRELGDTRVAEFILDCETVVPSS